MNNKFEIISSKRLDRNFTELFHKAFILNYKIFKRNPRKFKITVCQSKTEFKKEARYYYQDWATATVLRNGNLVIKSPNISTKWKESDYPNIINHEMNHVFWRRLFNTIKPHWLEEGLACNVGKNFSKYDLKKLIVDYNIDHRILYYRYIRKKMTDHLPFYPIWQGFTDYIIRKAGQKSVIDLIHKFSKNPYKENYETLFMQLFGYSEKFLFDKYLRSI